MAIQHLGREDFLLNYWHYEPGEQVIFVEPSQQGKTHLAFQLLQHTDMSGMRPPVSIVLKPRDPTPAEWSERLGWREVESWPPTKYFWQSPAPGYTLWPKHEMGLDPASLERTNANLRNQTQRALLDAYKQGDQIVFADEVFAIIADLGLYSELNALWTRGSGMGAGLWSATQKASGSQHASIPGQMYNSATHLFFGKDPDVRSQKRLADVGGMDPEMLAYAISNLKLHTINTPHGQKSVSEKLYIDKRGPYMSIIHP